MALLHVGVGISGEEQPPTEPLFNFGSFSLADLQETTDVSQQNDSNSALSVNCEPLTLRELVLGVSPEYSSLVAQPRGLINRGNMCFVHCVMQSLFGCPEFIDVLSKLSAASGISCGTPVLEEMLKLLSEFELVERRQLAAQSFCPPDDAEQVDMAALTKSQRKRAKKKLAKAKNVGHGTGSYTHIPIGAAFEPLPFYSLLDPFHVKTKSSGPSTQEDAQEFLNFLLDTLHEELCGVAGINSADAVVANDDDWEEVGKGNKTSTISKISLEESLVTRIFRGSLRSSLSRSGAKNSATLQPFLCLPVDLIDGVSSLKDAMLYMSSPEMLDDYTTDVGVARRVMTLDALPQILIVHVKRFGFAHNAAEKVRRHLAYDGEMKLDTRVLSGQAITEEQSPLYELVAVIEHHGHYAVGGHYTSDVLQGNGEWLHFDDAVVTPVALEEVLQRQAYLLFWRRKHGT